MPPLARASELCGIGVSTRELTLNDRYGSWTCRSWGTTSPRGWTHRLPMAQVLIMCGISVQRLMSSDPEVDVN
jgi:hypothetical protein